VPKKTQRKTRKTRIAPKAVQSIPPKAQLSSIAGVAQIQRFMTKDLRLTESGMSLVLGAVIVVCSALLAYMFFAKVYEQTTPKLSIPAQSKQLKLITGPEGEISGGVGVVALPTTHIVEPGENLWKIAEYYYRSGYNTEEIMKANGISNPNNIEVGQKIVIPKIEIRIPASDNGVTPEIVDSKIMDETYTVIPGDNLWMIALRAYGDGYKWPEIVKANNLSSPDAIETGMKLLIPR
jgi:nucleoid-associated protein YgaU